MTKKKVISLVEEKVKEKKKKINELLDLARMILESDKTIYVQALTANILLWSDSIDVSRQIDRLKVELQKRGYPINGLKVVKSENARG